jgi:nitrite reductase (NO-forming)
MKIKSFLYTLLIPLAVSAAFIYRTEFTAYGDASSPQLVIDEIKGEEPARMSKAPLVPAAITRRHATKVLLDLEIKEHTKTLADGVTYTYWTFGDDAPGNFLRVREGDVIETTLHNHPDNTVAHNIDFHSATGPGGGGEASFVAPGHSATFSWRAMRPGLYLYHCVAAPAGMHLANGMYGLILVEPKEGLPPVDKEYFLVQGEFYTEGRYGQRGQQSFSMEKALKEQPDYVVFNGHVGALMGDGALRVNTGDSVRLYLGNAGPSLVSSFHVVGEIFDNVYAEGGATITQHSVQTTLVPVGGSSMVEFVADVPGSYQMVDHSMFRAFNKGAMGILEVSGDEQPQLFSAVPGTRVYQPGTRLNRAPALASNNTEPSVGKIPSKATAAGNAMAHGKQVYEKVCATCHQLEGQGMPGVFPPLARSDFLLADPARATRIVLQGLNGKITVNGQPYDSVMPPLGLSNEDAAAVLNYVTNSFGNTGGKFTVAQVASARNTLEGKTRLSQAPDSNSSSR